MGRVSELLIGFLSADNFNDLIVVIQYLEIIQNKIVMLFDLSKELSEKSSLNAQMAEAEEQKKAAEGRTGSNCNKRVTAGRINSSRSIAAEEAPKEALTGDLTNASGTPKSPPHQLLQLKMLIVKRDGPTLWQLWCSN